MLKDSSEIPQVKQAKERTRVCTPPVNGGAPCEYLGPAVEECDSDECAGEQENSFIDKCTTFFSEPSVLGRWSDWKCEQVCFNPNKEELTTEVRDRTCTDAIPRHSTQNCDNLVTRERSGNQCSGKTAVPMCKYL